MPNIRLFLEEKIVDSESIILDSKNIHYLKRVMRKKNGDKITIFNGKEQWEGKLNLSEATVKPERKTGFLEFVPDIQNVGLTTVKSLNEVFLIKDIFTPQGDLVLIITPE